MKVGKVVELTRSDEYESIVATIVRKITASAGVHVEAIGHGKTNKIMGVSGYKHQIDVSVDAPECLLLVECKCWKKKITTDAVLTLTARIQDIAAKAGKPVKGAIVTMKGVGRGAEILARYYDVDLQTVRSPEEFYFKYGATLNVGVTDNAGEGLRDDIIHRKRQPTPVPQGRRDPSDWHCRPPRT